MCGRFTSTASPEELMRKFGVTILQNLRPRWNVAPSQQALVIVRDGLQSETVTAQWGLPPVSAKHSFLINARAETVQEKPTFRDAFQHRRCLVVASGWYEWSAPKTPWHIQLCDGGVMAFGGLLFGPPEQQRFVIMTTRADAGLADIHHRARWCWPLTTLMRGLAVTCRPPPRCCARPRPLGLTGTGSGQRLARSAKITPHW